LLLRRTVWEEQQIRHSCYTTAHGKRRYFRCKGCGRTFCPTHGNPYYRLHKPRSLFDEIVCLCVHGVGVSAMARIKRMTLWISPSLQDWNIKPSDGPDTWQFKYADEEDGWNDLRIVCEGTRIRTEVPAFTPLGVGGADVGPAKMRLK
jgi:hypothetical protein